MAKSSASQQSAARLPSTRESRPALLGLAILLIVGGALASGWLAIQSGHRAYFVQVSTEVAQGSRISSSDLKRVSLPQDFQGGVKYASRSRIVGKAAATRLLPGTVLTRAMVSDKAGLKPGEAEQSFTYDDSPFIDSLGPGAPLVLSIGSSSGDSRKEVRAELVSVGRNKKSGGIAGGDDDTVNLQVSFDSSCLPLVSQGVEDKSITPSLVGEDTDVPTTCGS